MGPTFSRAFIITQITILNCHEKVARHENAITNRSENKLVYNTIRESIGTNIYCLMIM